jgi:transcriptional regulator with XRE-family HTH domain
MKKNVKIDNKAIGQRIREERQKFELSREEFAEIIGLSDYYVGQLERGERQMSLPVLVKIANCLHLTLDYLIFGKTTYDGYYSYDSYYVLDSPNNNMHELADLLKKCSSKELALINKLIKTVLPYL